MYVMINLISSLVDHMSKHPAIYYLCCNVVSAHNTVREASISRDLNALMRVCMVLYTLEGSPKSISSIPRICSM